MIEIIAVAVVGILGFYSGWKAREQAAARRVDELLEYAEAEALREIKENVIRISIEKHQDVYYVYNMDDQSFMAQGKDRKELESILASKYPGKSFAATKENLYEMGFAS
jgi:hypothetical protein